jgi:tRNA uridine 5-carboxymethylaminomethyl modification enzyme
MGFSPLLVTQRKDRIGWMSCNPSVGGVGKGHVVRELDALGGVMPVATDRCGIQFRRLNTRKGPAVQATRVQVDMRLYALEVQRLLAALPGITVVEDEVCGLELNGGQVGAVLLAGAGRVEAQAVLVCTGTFLKGRIFVGLDSHSAGRVDEPSAERFSASLADAGLRLIRLKTGTPPRLAADSIDYTRLEPQPGDLQPPFFHWATTGPRLPQVQCHLTSTTARTHEIVRSGLSQSPLYRGLISGVGPRYCPSIEDKVVRYPHHQQHHLFLEPTGLDSGEVYPAGLSSSLTASIQEAAIHSIPGLERARILTFAYGIEYDAVDSRGLTPALACKGVPGLFLAGQVNGTSGYEEAAGQGALAGVNAGLWLRGEAPLVLGRAQAYIGVMADDLTATGTDEPYRLFTSRAEYRLLLREGNAEERLGPVARKLGLLTDQHLRHLDQRQAELARGEAAFRSTRVAASEALDAWADGVGTARLKEGATLAELLLRPEVGLDELASLHSLPNTFTPAIGCELETRLKYGGYIEREEQSARRLRAAETLKLPEDLDYATIAGLSREISEKLSRLRPATLGAAMRLPGVTPAAVGGILVMLQHGRGLRGDKLPPMGTVDREKLE